MKKPLQVALVCAGPVKRAAVVKLPELRNSVTYIKGLTSAAASRAAHAVGRGKPARDWDEIASADVIALLMPHGTMREVLADLLDSRLPLARRVILLIDAAELDSSALHRHEAAGAWGASIDAEHAPDGALLIEGHREALRRLRAWLKLRTREGVVELRRGGKSVVGRAMDTAADQFVPLLATLVQEFIAAGMTKAAAERAAACLVQTKMQAYFRAGRRLLRP